MTMSHQKLSYLEQGKIYHADTCIPLEKAWKSGKVQLEAWARNDYPGYRITEHVLPAINSIGYWDAHYPQEWGLGWHRNEGIEITFLERGNIPFSLGDQQYNLCPDELTITRPWQPHKVGNPNVGAGKLHWLILDVEVRHPHQEWVWPSWILLNQQDLEELTKMLRQNEQPIWKTNAEIRRCFIKIAQLITNNETARGESWAFLYINELLMHLLNLFREGSFDYNSSLTDSSRTVELFIKYLGNNYVEPWTLEAMAGHCQLGITRFVHYFKQLTNTTPMQYLNFIRLESAAASIPNLKKNINEICYECGFSSSQYFATLFKKQYGCSPIAFRQKNLVPKEVLT
jgi:AraC family L-rhamnose operon regulatory protein RhaS